MSIRAVIFDLDGTITQPFFDFDVIRREMGLAKDSGPVLESMQRMSPEQRKEAERVLHHYEKRAVTESELNTGARETLRALRSEGIRVGILTRNKRSNALAVAQKHGLEFDEVVDREDGPAKPDAFGVLEICRRFGVKPKETLVVGDYLYDLLCARAADAIPVLLTNSNSETDFEKHADFTIKRLDQILQIIEDEK